MRSESQLKGASGSKVRLGFSLTPEAQRLLGELKKKLGIDHTAIVELSIRRLAEIESVPINVDEQQK